MTKANFKLNACSPAIITFISDFGDQDWFVAAVKGEILKINKDALIVDVTHRLRPHDIRASAFLLNSVYRNFPKGTIHLAVVDPGVGGARKPLIVESNGYFFVGPDNGIFSYIYTAKSRVHKIMISKSVSSTFHARDIFGPVAARLAQGVKPNALGSRIKRFVKFVLPTARKQGHKIFGEIIYTDHFGNLITNIPNHVHIKEICVRKKKILVRNAYGEAGCREIVSVRGSTGCYEIAANMSSAMKSLGVATGAKVWARIQARREIGAGHT